MILNSAAVLMIAIWALALCLTLCGTLYALKRFKQTPPRLDHPFMLYPVSVLKPLKGAEPGLLENLESFFNLDYPDYELLFSAADPHDPACEIVRHLQRVYPTVKAYLISARDEVGINPKVNNLVRSYDLAKNDLILISDSNVRVPRAYLKRLVAHLDTGTGLITAVVAGRGAQGLGAHLEAMYLNTFYARFMQLVSGMGRACVVGKSMLMRKSTAARFGGITVLARYLAEDYMAGIAMEKLGLRVVIASDPVHQHIGRYTVRDFWNRHLRWGRIRRAQAPLPFAFEPLLGSIVSGLLGAAGAQHLAGISPAVFLFFHLLTWSACDFAQVARLSDELHPLMPIAWFVRELAAVPLWLHILSGRTVLWRGKRFAIESGGLLSQNPS